MSLIPAKCTQCGANIEVDDTHEAGICKYCGTAFITEKAINNYNTYITNNNSFAGATINVVGADIDNLLKLATEEIEIKNETDALDHINRALEINPACSEAWFLKMKAMTISPSATDPKLSEIIRYGTNAIKFAREETKQATELKVYEFFLDFAVSLMAVASMQVGDTAKVSALFKSAGINLAAIATVQQSDAVLRRGVEQITINAIELKKAVPQTLIAKYDSLQERTASLAKWYVEYCQKDLNRAKIYGLKPDDLDPNATERRKASLESIKEGLNENTNNLEIENSTHGGCYVATAVYGSYDCPEVWTLRRYRDYTLSKSLGGRCFINLYYMISPTIVKWFGKSIWFNNICKPILDCKAAKLNADGVLNTPYED